MSSSTSASETSTNNSGMPRALHGHQGRFALCVGLAFIMLATCLAHAEQTISVVRHGVTTPLTLPEYTSQGVGYASMADLARQLGASVTVADARASFSLDGRAVDVGLNDTEARAGDSVIALQHPVLGYEGDALIAMADVVPFLRGGFGFGTPDAPPSTSALAQPPETVSTPDTVPEPAMEEIPLEAVEVPGDTGGAPEENLESVSIDSSASESTPAPSAQTLDAPFGDPDSVMLAIDPGHGGEDSGTVGAGGLTEKELCLAVAGALRRELKEEYGIATVITRESDESASFQERMNRATSAGANLVVSLHGGASTAPGAAGYQILAHKPKRSLSMDPKPALDAARTLAAVLDGATNQAARPVREAPLRLALGSNLPCIQVELGNILNPDDEARLTAETYQRTLVESLARGIYQAVGGAKTTGSTS